MTYGSGTPHGALNYHTPNQFMLKYGKLHSHPSGLNEFPTFQHVYINNNLKSIVLNAKV
jgi:hypothetical protein